MQKRLPAGSLFCVWIYGFVGEASHIIRPVTAQPARSQFWRAITLVGAGLVAIGIGAGYLVDTTGLDFVSRYFDLFMFPALIGVPLSFVGCIGWAVNRGRRGRVHMAAFVFAFPWLLLLLGYPFDGVKLHGAAAPVMLLVIPATVLTVVLLIMSTVTPQEQSDRSHRF